MIIPYYSNDSIILTHRMSQLQNESTTNILKIKANSSNEDYSVYEMQYD